MAITEAAYLKTMWDRNECPNCHRVFPVAERVGTGRKAEGGYCSLDCYARYNALEFAEKAILARQGRAVQ